MITFARALRRWLKRRSRELPADQFGEPPRESAKPGDPFFEGVKAATGSHQGFTGP